MTIEIVADLRKAIARSITKEQIDSILRSRYGVDITETEGSAWTKNEGVNELVMWFEKESDYKIAGMSAREFFGDETQYQTGSQILELEVK